MLCIGTEQGHVATGSDHRAQVGAGFDPVGQDAVRRDRRMQSIHALDPNSAAAMAFDARTHRDQQFGQVADFGLLGRVLEQGLTIGQRGGHHQVLSTGDRDHVGGDAGSAQASGLGQDVTVLDADLGTHRLQALDVLVDRPRADRAAPGQRYPRVSTAREQRAQHQDRSTHGLDQIVGRFGRRDLAGVQCHRVAGRSLGDHTHAPQQPEHRRDVLQLRHVVQQHRLVDQQRSAQFWQGRVLGAGNRHLAGQAAAAAYQEFVHELGPGSEPLGGPGACASGGPAAACQCWMWCGSGDAAHSAGVKVFIDSAWIWARILSPSAV